jgi:hypothetical protein
MSFQAYLDNIQKQTGVSSAEWIRRWTETASGDGDRLDLDQQRRRGERFHHQ